MSDDLLKALELIEGMSMKSYEVTVIGTGPAGGQCARELSQQGFRVLLVDRAKSFLENNYSSGAAPLELMDKFQLPETVLGTYWNHFRIRSTQAQAIWTSSTPSGVIVDFDKLRAFLAAETERAGGEFHLGWQYQHHQQHDRFLEVFLKDLITGEVFSVSTTVLVDATGTERKVLASLPSKHRTVIATGIEYHIQVNPDVYQTYAHALNFFLGHHWMPQGYSWIFPMAGSQLKVGVIRYFQDQKYVPYEPSYKIYLQRMLDLCGHYEIEDRHGKTLYYTRGQKDVRHRGAVLAIGDAISSINPLGWEGIRHAMVSGRLAAQSIQKYLRQETNDFRSYDQSLRRYFGHKWLGAELFMHQLYKTKHDSFVDQSVQAFNLMNQKEILQVVFDYQFRYALKSYFYYFLSRLKSGYQSYGRTS